MKLNTPLLTCIIFVGGAAAGAVASWVLKPAWQSSTMTLPTPTTSLASVAPNEQRENNGLDATINAALSSSQTTSATSVASTFTIAEINSPEWLHIDDRSSYRKQLKALNHIASANEAELLDIIDVIERDTQQSYERIWVYRATLQRWSEIDAQAAIWHLEELISIGNMNSMGQQFEVIRALASTDYNALTQWLANLDPQQAQYQHIVEQAYSVLAEYKPRAALNHVLQSNSSNITQQQSIEQIVMQWSNQEPLAALEWIEQHPELIQSSDIKEMATMNLMHSDPQAGLAMIPTIKHAQRRMDMEAEYAAQIANTSPEQAYVWASELSNSASRNNAQQRALEVWSYSEPEIAIDFISSLPAGEINDGILHNLYSSAAHAKGMADPSNAMSWADTLPAQFVQTARQAVFYSWVDQSPEDALQWAEYSVDPQLRESLIQSVAPIISNRNLDLALRLYPGMSADTQSQMAYGIVQQLYDNDPSSAENWVSTLPQGLASIEATTTLVMSMSNVQPGQALDLAIQQTGEVRTQLLMQLTYTISAQQPDVFQSWVAGADLSAEERQMMYEASEQLNSENSIYFDGMGPFGSIDHY
ncbi:MAG: hypothetical protein V3U65_02720 [Granulosicoccaceae bacterium]